MIHFEMPLICRLVVFHLSINIPNDLQALLILGKIDILKIQHEEAVHMKLLARRWAFQMLEAVG